VVGLGGSGLTCIGALLDRGLRVIGIDGGVVAGGAAGRNGGFLTAGAAGFYHRAVESLGQARARALYALTLREVDRINAETPEAVRGIGVLRIALTPEEDADCLAHLDALQADGFPAQQYDGPEGSGLLLPSDGSFQPLLRCRILARRVADRGAILYENTPALDVIGTQVTTLGGMVRCGVVIVAVDGHLERVLPELAATGKSEAADLLRSEQ
jgi:glycine/D-amino acid oxidase-like deaminating enzyme